VLLLQKGKVDEAIAQWQKALGMKPDYTEVRVNLGGAFVMQGRFTEAMTQWREALRLEPNRLPALTNLAWMLATCPDLRIRNGAQAVGLAERAVELAGRDDPMILDTLGAAYAEAGRFAEAIETTRRAAILAAQRNDQSLANELNTRLALYQTHKPFRDSK
jgi:Flp pilus assembly protein TadD